MRWVNRQAIPLCPVISPYPFYQQLLQNFHPCFLKNAHVSPKFNYQRSIWDTGVNCFCHGVTSPISQQCTPLNYINANSVYNEYFSGRLFTFPCCIYKYFHCVYCDWILIFVPCLLSLYIIFIIYFTDDHCRFIYIQFKVILYYYFITV